MGKKMLRVRVSGELWKATHIEALNKGVNVGVVVEDALRLYFAVNQGDVSIVPKPGASLSLTTVKPNIIQCGQAKESTPVGVKEPTPVSPMPAPTAVVDAEAPSFVKGNPWLEIISRRNGG